MKYNPKIHQRKPIRLKNYDYSQSGYYFITICSYNRELIFGKIENEILENNEIGNIALNILFDLQNQFKNTSIDTSILMPNHLHAIIKIDKPQDNVGAELALPKEIKAQSVGAELALTKENKAQNVGAELALTKKELPSKRAEQALPLQDKNQTFNIKNEVKLRSPSLSKIIQTFKSISTIQINKFRKMTGITIWQRNYFEHIIRDEIELYEIRKYIEYNYLNWKNDEYNNY